MEFVISKEDASWFVDGKRVDVKDGDVVGFTDARDALHFIEEGRAEIVSEDEVDAALSEPNGDDDMLKQKLENKAMRTDSAKSAPVKKAAKKAPVKKTTAKKG